MTTKRRIAAIAAIIAVGVSVAAWLVRDLPRHRLEKALSGRLGRPVTVERLHLLAPDRFRLEGFEAAGVAGMPWLGTVRFDDIEVEGTLAKLLAGNIATLQLRGGNARLVAPPWPEEPPLPPSELRVGHLELEGFELVVPAPAGSGNAPPARLALEGEMDGFTGSLDEKLRFAFHGSAERFEIAPVAAFALALASPEGLPGEAPGGYLEDLELDLRWPGAPDGDTATGGEPGLRLEVGATRGEILAAAGRATLEAPHLSASIDQPLLSGRVKWQAAAVELEPVAGPTRRLEAPRLEIAVERGEATAAGNGAALRIEASAALPPILPSAEGSASWSAAGELAGLDLTTSEIDLAALIPWLGAPPQLEAQGTLRLSAATTDGRIEGKAVVDLVRVALAVDGSTFEGRGAHGEVVARWPLDGPPERAVEVESHWLVDQLRIPRPGETPARLGGTQLDLEARIAPQRWQQSSTLSAVAGLLEGPVEVRLDLPSGSAPGPGGDALAGIVPARLEGSVSAGSAAAPGSTEQAVVDLRLRTGGLGAGRIEGPVGLAGGAADLDLTWSWKLADLAAALGSARSTGLEIPEDLRVSGAASARGTLRGTVRAPRVVATLGLEGASAGLGEHAVRAISGSVRVRWPASATGAGAAAVLGLDKLALEARAQPAGLGELPISLHGAGSWSGNRIDVRNLALSTENQGRLELDGWLALPAARVDVKLVGAGLGEWREYLRPITGELGSELVLDGAAAADLHLESDAQGAWSADGSSEIKGTGFTSNDGSRVLQGLGSRGTLHAAGAPGKPISFHAESAIDGFQLLWDTFFGDFSALTSGTTFDGTWGPALPDGGAPSWSLHGVWSLPEGPLADVTLEEVGEEDLRYTAKIQLDNLRETFSRHVHGPLVDAAPDLEDLEVSGAFRLSAHGRIGESGSSLEGQVSAAGLGIEHQAIELGVHDLFLELPLALGIDADGTLHAAEIDGRGRLGYSSMAFRGLELPAVDTELAVHGERIELEQALDVPLLGGHVVLERLALRRLLQPDRSFECALRVSGIQLPRLAEDLGLFPLEGTVEAYLPQVRLQGDSLEIAGGGRVDLFGGFVEVGDLAAEKLFDPFPRFRFSARFEDIDLEKLTGQLDFGEMTGLVEGQVTDVEVVGTAPVRFEALIRSPDKRQKRRVVSVRAINNIAILGTGAGTNILDRGIHKFFNRYTYGALGISMSLRGDAFRLRGLEHRGDRELFLRGRLPFPIDVVNAQPGGAVSFQTMVRRLRSLDVSKATTGPAPP